MSAYVIFIRDNTVDEQEMVRYADKAAGAADGHPLTPLAFYGAVETLEGDAAEGVVILEFPDMAAAKAWYHSPAYQAARQHRLKGANYRVILTEGV